MAEVHRQHASRPRRRAFGLATALLLVGTALGLASCSASVSGNVTLVPTRPGVSSNIVGYQFIGSVADLQIRLTSGSGRSVGVQPYHFEGTYIHRGQTPPSTVLDAGPDSPWTTVSDVFPFSTVQTADRVVLRLTTAATTDVPLTVEARGIDASGQVTGSTFSFSPFGADCGRVQPHADLTGVDLKLLDLRNCVMPGVKLDAAKLSNTNLSGADLSQATILPGTFDGTFLRYAELGNATLAGVTFGTADVLGVNLAQANLDGAVLRGTYLGEGQLDGTRMTLANLDGVSSTNLTGTPLLPSGWILRNGILISRTANLNDAQLDGIDLHGFDLSGAHLSGAHLAGADLHGTNLAGAEIGGADLHGANLSGANLTNTVVNVLDHRSTVSFTGANLSGATFNGADLEADWAGANLSGTKLAGAKLAGSYSGQITGTPASLPTGWTLTAGYLIGPGAVFIGVNFSGYDFHGRNLTGTVFGGGSDLHGADFTGANLTGAAFGEANVTGTKFAGATFTNGSSNDLVGTPASFPTGMRLVGAAFFGATARVTRLDLSGANLAGADLHGLNCDSCTLTGTNFTGTNLRGSEFYNLAGANLTGADLTGAVLWNDLTHNTITGTILTGATLHDYADLTGDVGTPIYAGVDFSHVTCPDGTWGGQNDGGTCQGHPWP